MLLGAILEAQGEPKTFLECSWIAPGALLTAFEDQAVIKLLGHDSDMRIESLDLNARNLVIRSYNLIRGFQNHRRISNAYPWIVYSGNFSPLADHNHLESKNILYCHSPPRFIYDLKEYYEDRQGKQQEKHKNYRYDQHLFKNCE